MNRTRSNRKAGYYNMAGQFVSAGELVPDGAPQRPRNNYKQQNQEMSQQQQMPQQQNYMTVQPQVQQPHQQQQQDQSEDIDMRESKYSTDQNNSKDDIPKWMKSKLTGVKKVSNKKRRRRQNEFLRRLLTPKNALMVLNEMMPNEQISNQFKVEPTANKKLYSASPPMFSAGITVEGVTYQGFGENKMSARNAAAEQAIRDLIIRRLDRAADAPPPPAADDPDADEAEALPMLQLASFALHKLFAEWEYAGHKVPALRAPAAGAGQPAPGAGPGEAPAAGAGARKERVLPAGAASMHPTMLLTQMRPDAEYRELAAQGDRPQNMVFTMSVDIDGRTYIGKGSSKKEARKQAARAACQDLFDVKFDAKFDPVPPPATA